jgi:hypothetical protein
MADTTTVMALPFPEGSDANDVPADMQALAERLDEAPGIESLTSAGDLGADRWAEAGGPGRVQLDDVEAAGVQRHHVREHRCGGLRAGDDNDTDERHSREGDVHVGG